MMFSIDKAKAVLDEIAPVKHKPTKKFTVIYDVTAERFGQVLDSRWPGVSELMKSIAGDESMKKSTFVIKGNRKLGVVNFKAWDPNGVVQVFDVVGANAGVPTLKIMAGATKVELRVEFTTTLPKAKLVDADDYRGADIMSTLEMTHADIEDEAKKRKATKRRPKAEQVRIDVDRLVDDVDDVMAAGEAQ